MSRSLAYEGLDESNFPTPYLDIVAREKIFCPGVQPSKLGAPRPVGLDIIAPQQVRMGWLFAASDLESQRIILTTITDGLVRINSYLQDGYLNHNTSDSVFYFDAVVASDNQLEQRFAQSGKQGGYSRWVPTTEVFEMLMQTRNFYSEVAESTKSPEDHESDFAWLTDEGVGNAEVAASINDAIYYFLIPRKQWGGVASYAQTAIALEVPNQSTNARSNWGIANFMEGDYESAKSLFLAALEREDKFSEDEASYYLSVIYEKEGDKKRSEIYRKRCELAGGYTPTFI
jgi:tetratricopeptide (TPR) repeat protein